MFTGIIQKVARVLDSTHAGDHAEILIDTGYAEPLELGESIAVNGACLTVAAVQERSRAKFFLSRETLARTALEALKSGSRVNLERSLRASDGLSGHIVQGHVDGLGQVARIADHPETREIELALPPTLARYCVEKGSICVNGVSLTVNSVDPVGLMIIPHTLSATNLADLRVGDWVNIEVDVLAKYLERLCQPYLKH